MARITSMAFATLATAAAALAPATGNAATVVSPTAQLMQFYVYPNYGDGDVVFNINATVAGCDGYWLSPADPGFRQTYAALLMVKASGGTLVVYAYNDTLWPGSSVDKYCRVRTLRPT